MNTEMFDLTGKTAIVTGGGNGIGKACSSMLADFGASGRGCRPEAERCPGGCYAHRGKRGQGAGAALRRDQR